MKGSVTSKAASTEARPVSSILSSLADAAQGGELRAFPSGFDPLDRVLSGGIRGGELALVSGMPGAGKTIFALQWARSLALAGTTAVYACYEHDDATMIGRLLALELGASSTAGPDAEDSNGADPLKAALRAGRSIQDLLADTAFVGAAEERIGRYADKLWLSRASGSTTDVAALAEMAARAPAGDVVLFVDYLQKIAMNPDPGDEMEKVTRLVSALKDLALTTKMPIVSIVASDQEGLAARRLRLHHLRGSSALAYESDIVLLLNDKYDAVSKVHLAYDPVRAATFKHWTVFSVEKNRRGLASIDLEYRKDFGHYRFDPSGNIVQEKLVDERVYTE